MFELKTSSSNALGPTIIILLMQYLEHLKFLESFWNISWVLKMEKEETHITEDQFLM